MTKIVQEKFEHHYPQRPARDHAWASDSSARTRKGLQTRADSGVYNSYRADLNCLPPGMDMDKQEVAEINAMRTVTGGTDDVTDNPVGNDFRKGYVGLKLRPTDDQFSREHQDAFYDEVTVDGVTGYLERNNTLDRA